MKTHLLIGLSVLSLLAGCGRVSEPDRSESEPLEPAGAAAAPHVNMGGDGLDHRPRAVLMSLGRESTSVDIEPRFNFVAQCPGDTACHDSPQILPGIITSHLELVDEDGNAIPLRAELMEQKGTPSHTEVPVTVTVERALEEDHWYTLRVSSDQELVAGSLDLTSERVRLAAAAPTITPGLRRSMCRSSRAARPTSCG
ncbi:MAG: hypothetical protein R3B70_47550 [Polyangiaceae bacterium]